MRKTALVLLSGGMDSAAALWWARERFRVVTLSLLVPGAAAGERRAARALSKAAGAAEHCEVRLDFLRNRRRTGPQGYLPRRNLVFYSVAASVAEQVGARLLVGGHLATDGTAFPDARPEFFSRVGRMVGLPLRHPFLRMRKPQVVRFGRRRGVPFEITWSCYRNGPDPCGSCVSCRERAAAFRTAEEPS